MHAYDAVDVDDNVSYCLSPFGILCFAFFLLLFLVLMSPVRM